MQKNLINLVLLSLFATTAIAATEIKPEDIPALNPDEGRIGEVRKVVERASLECVQTQITCHTRTLSKKALKIKLQKC